MGEGYENHKFGCQRSSGPTVTQDHRGCAVQPRTPNRHYKQDQEVSSDANGYYASA